MVVAVSWSPDGKRIVSASCGGSQVQVWDAINGSHYFTYTGHPANGVLTVAWSPDGSRIASAGDDGNVRVWDASTGQDVFFNHFGHLNGFQKSDPINSWRGHQIAHVSLRGAMAKRCRCGTHPMVRRSTHIVGILMPHWDLSLQWRGHPKAHVSLRGATTGRCRCGMQSMASMSISIVDIQLR